MGILFIHERGRRVIALILAIATGFFLTACDPTESKKPFNFVGTIWVCEEEKACVAVIKQESFGYSYGEIQTDAGVIPITMIYDIANRGRFRDFYEADSPDAIYSQKMEPENNLWKGRIEYHTNRFILKKADEGKVYSLFPDEDLPLTFVRYNVPEEDLLPLVPWDAKANLTEGFEPGGLWELTQDLLEKYPPKRKIQWFNFDLSDFWPDPFGVSDRKSQSLARDAQP